MYNIYCIISSIIFIMESIYAYFYRAARVRSDLIISLECFNINPGSKT